jgi:glutathione synthase/RimK-type ligase-like ATP-grasp enzyme
MRATVLVPAPEFHEAWDWAYDVESAVLRYAGFEVTPQPWTEMGGLTEADLVMPLVAWGYHLQPVRWHALLDQLERDGVPTLNPVPLLRWNSDKRYLAELGAKGIAVIPTILVEAIEESDLDEARARFGSTLVIKPPVSASADGTFKLGPDDPLPASAHGKEMLIQPYLQSVAREGEYSIIMFGGHFSHSIVKRPKAGDYRVQPHLGGTEVPCDPPEGAVELARAALLAAPAEATYARVDMVRNDHGALTIIELELIEPALWLQHSSDNGAAFASAIRTAAGLEKQPLANG